MNSTCPCQQPKQPQPTTGTGFLGLPQGEVIQVDPNTEAAVRAALAQVKAEGLTVGGMGGGFAGLVLGLLLAGLAGRRKS